jgi:hypothetical protein
MITYLAARPLLEQNPAPPPQGPEFGGSSPIALVVTLVLAVALILLIRSMNKHLRKVPPSFDQPGRSRPAKGDDSSADATDSPRATDSATESPATPDTGEHRPTPDR